MVESDVMIIGGGLAGWRAAEAAVAGGASVTLVANGVGNSPEIHALNCPVLPEDSVQQFIDDTLSSGKYENDPVLVEAMCRESVHLKEEFDFDDTIIRPLGSTIPRCVSIKHAIGAIALGNIKKRLKDKVVLENRTMTVDELLKIRAEYPSKKIIIATGGWCGKYDFSTNPAYLKGDGLTMAKALGGTVKDVDMDHVQYEPTVRVEGPRRGIPVITTLLYEGARLLNMEGKEFLGDARLNKDELSKAIFDQGGYAFYDLTDVPDEKILECKMDLSERMIKVAPAPHSSLGGIVIDSKCHVLASDGSIVPGLFACGEVTGGIHGLNRLGGNGGTVAMVFGTIAGREAALEVKNDI